MAHAVSLTSVPGSARKRSPQSHPRHDISFSRLAQVRELKSVRRWDRARRVLQVVAVILGIAILCTIPAPSFAAVRSALAPKATAKSSSAIEASSANAERPLERRSTNYAFRGSMPKPRLHRAAR